MKATTPVNVARLAAELSSHPDRSFVTHLCDGLTNGFDTLVHTTDLPTKECRNLLSARTQPDIVANILHDECTKGYMLGPFPELPFQNYRVNPIGIVEGKYSFKKRLIVDLSSPHSGSQPSVNDLMDKEQCSLTYVKIDDAIRAIQKSGPFAILCKFDIKDAFKLLPIHPSQWHLFCLRWNKQYYVPVRLQFGGRSSPVLFDKLAQAICWIAKHNYDTDVIFHLLDDFLTVDNPLACGERTMALLCTMFKHLHIPLAENKTLGPTTVLEYLGVILDSEKMEARLPMVKIHRICEFIHILLHKHHCTKRELLQILGHFNFASKVILPGRSFVSYLIKLSTTVSQLHHYVHLTRECRDDLLMWHKFLIQWNGVSMFHEPFFTSSSDLQLYTDAASTVGFGGYYKFQWFYSIWPMDLPDIPDMNLSMAFRELYPIVIAAVLWGHEWKGKKILFMCDNMATVFIVNKGRSKCTVIMKLMRRLTWCAAINNYHFSAQYVHTKSNNAADALSRHQISRFRRLVPQAYPQPCPGPPPCDVMWF